MKDSTSIENDLEMHPTRKNEGPFGGRCRQIFQIIFMW